MKKTFLITLVLVSSFFLTGLISKNVFLSNTPKINPGFIAKIKNPQLNNLFAFNKKSPDSGSSNPIFKQVSKGVYASDNTSDKIVEFREGEINWTEITVNTASGKIVKLRIPADESPDQDLINLIKSE